VGVNIEHAAAIMGVASLEIIQEGIQSIAAGNVAP
jgi:hypothetical protein